MKRDDICRRLLVLGVLWATPVFCDVAQYSTPQGANYAAGATLKVMGIVSQTSSRTTGSVLVFTNGGTQMAPITYESYGMHSDLTHVGSQLTAASMLPSTVSSDATNFGTQGPSCTGGVGSCTISNANGQIGYVTQASGSTCNFSGGVSLPGSTSVRLSAGHRVCWLQAAHDISTQLNYYGSTFAYVDLSGGMTCVCGTVQTGTVTHSEVADR